MKNKNKIIKRISALFLCLTIVITTMNMPVFTMKVKAATQYNVDINGIYYDLYDNGKAYVTNTLPIPGTYSGDIVIPSTVNYNGKNYEVTQINHVAFKNCTGLNSIILPDGILYIGLDAFVGCDNLTIEFLGSNPPDIAPGGAIPSTAKIRVPNGSASRYEAAFTSASITIPASNFEEAPSAPSPSSSASKSSSMTEAHSHTLSWVVTKAPTLTEDGIASLVCSSCGYVESTQTISRAGVVYTDVANKFEASLRNLQPGKKALLELGDWHSVPSYLMERVINSNVDVEITYKYKGKNYDITVPAGKGIDLHIPWYGPLLMNALYNK